MTDAYQTATVIRSAISTYERIGVMADDQTAALLAILKLNEAEIREGRFSDVDEFLAELQQDSDEGKEGR